ncbi:MAG: gluconate 2-dehydrogenase subunit 3 family protein, partial [Pedobacter sp.]
MKRRSLIKNLVVFTGGVFLFSGCTGDQKPSSVFLKNISINADQELLLEELLETIIPESSTPGSKKLGLHLFVLKMVD